MVRRQGRSGAISSHRAADSQPGAPDSTSVRVSPPRGIVVGPHRLTSGVLVSVRHISVMLAEGPGPGPLRSAWQSECGVVAVTPVVLPMRFSTRRSGKRGASRQDDAKGRDRRAENSPTATRSISRASEIRTATRRESGRPGPGQDESAPRQEVMGHQRGVVTARAMNRPARRAFKHNELFLQSREQAGEIGGTEAELAHAASRRMSTSCAWRRASPGRFPFLSCSPRARCTM